MRLAVIEYTYGEYEGKITVTLPREKKKKKKKKSKIEIQFFSSFSASRSVCDAQTSCPGFLGQRGLAIGQNGVGSCGYRVE